MDGMSRMMYTQKEKIYGHSIKVEVLRQNIPKWSE